MHAAPIDESDAVVVAGPRCAPSVVSPRRSCWPPAARRRRTRRPSWRAEELYAEAKDETSPPATTTRRSSSTSGSKAAPPARRSRSRRSSSAPTRTTRPASRRRRWPTLDRFIKLHPTSPALDYALYLKGIVNFNDNLGHPRQPRAPGPVRARPAGVARFVPVVQAAGRALPGFALRAPTRALRMNYIVNSLAAYEVHVARYYYSRGAYVAAVNRAQQAVQEFQHVAVRRRGAVHPGAELRAARPDASCATTPTACWRRTIPNSAYLDGAAAREAEAVVAVLVSARSAR